MLPLFALLVGARLTLALSLPMMGTDARFYLPPEAPPGAADKAYAAMRAADRAFSDWRDDSELARVNAAAYPGPVTLSPAFAALTHTALTLAQRSGGAFDPTYGALERLWPFRGAVTNPPLPRLADVRAALGDVGYRAVKLARSGATLRYAKPGLRLGFGAIAKGAALDDAARALADQNVGAYVIELGGQWLVHGSTERIGLRDPFGGMVTAVVTLTGGSVATSAAYEKRLWMGGRWVGHVLDPRTGYPAEGVAAVAAFAPTATIADGLSTALYVLGPDAGARLLAKYPGAGARWVMADGRVEVRGEFPPVTVAGGLSAPGAAPTAPRAPAPPARRR